MKGIHLWEHAMMNEIIIKGKIKKILSKRYILKTKKQNYMSDRVCT